MSYTYTITPKYSYNTYTPGVKSFAHGANNVVLFDKRHNQTAPVSKTDLQIKQLKEEFKLAKNEQGIIGKAWNGIKNLFKTEYSSSNIEKALNSLNSNSTDEEINNVRNMIAKYRSKQDLAVDTVATTGATIAAGAVGAKVGAMIGSVICPGAGTIVGGILGYVGGAIVGAVAKVGICQLENMTDNVDNNAWHNDKNIGKQLTSGALSGATAMLFGGIAKKVSGACKSALGITKQGVVLAENGTANVAKTVARTALAEGAGGAAASTVIADGEYLIRCATDEDTNFSWNDLAQTTGISAVTGGVMSAGFGAITGYKNAIYYNKADYKLSKVTLDKGTKYLAEDGSLEQDAIYKITKEGYVCIKDKDSAIKILQKQHSALKLTTKEDIFVFNPNDAAKSLAAKKGSSNLYMTEWYAEANGLQDRIISSETIQDAIIKSKKNIITIIVPDDCAITGRSIIANTAKSLNKIELPAGKSIKLVYSPMITTNTAKNAFEGMSNFNIDMLKASNILNSHDDEFIIPFFTKFQGKISIKTAPYSIIARPYNQTQTFISLQKNNPELAQKVESILTFEGNGCGYGRTGQSGTMIAVPSPNGIKCPNNNIYGAAPYAIAEGATPSPNMIKVPGKIRAERWQNILKKMQEFIDKLA